MGDLRTLAPSSSGWPCEASRLTSLYSQIASCLQTFGSSITQRMAELLEEFEADVARVLYDTNGKGDKACTRLVPCRVDMVTDRHCHALKRMLREEFGQVDKNITSIFQKLRAGPGRVGSSAYPFLPRSDSMTTLPTDALDFAREIPYVKLQTLQTKLYAQIEGMRGEVRDRIEHVASYYGKMSRKEIKNKACRTLHDYLENELCLFGVDLVLQRCSINSTLADTSLGLEE